MSRLNHFFVTEKWNSSFRELKQDVLPKPFSDNFLVMLDCRGLRRDPTLFHFENIWLKEEGFKELINHGDGV